MTRTPSGLIQERPRTHAAMVPLAEELAHLIYHGTLDRFQGRGDLLTRVQSRCSYPVTMIGLGKALRAMCAEPYPVLHRIGTDLNRSYVWELPPEDEILAAVCSLGPRFVFLATGQVVLPEDPTEDD